MKCDVINLSVLHDRDHVFKNIFLHYESLTTNTYSRLEVIVYVIIMMLIVYILQKLSF